MKVCLIDPSLFTEPYDQALMRGLRASGDEVRLYTCLPTDRSTSLRDADILQHFYRLTNGTALSWLPQPLFLLCKGLEHGVDMRRLIGELKAWQPRVIHFQWTPLPVLDRWFLGNLRAIAPIVCTVHDGVPFNDNPSSWFQKIGALDVLRRFDALIVHTDDTLRRLRALRLGSRTIHKIPHGLLEEPAADAAPHASPLAASINILMFGKIKPYKGIDLLLRALALLSPKDRARCRATIAGKPYMDPRLLTRLATSLGVDDIVEFDFRHIEHGRISELFQRASVVVLPYRRIDASGVLFAAMARGCPVVATRIGGFAETLTDGRDAILVPPNDPWALALALHRLIGDPALRHRLAAGIRDLRHRTETWEAIGRMTHRLYNQMVADR